MLCIAKCIIWATMIACRRPYLRLELLFSFLQVKLVRSGVTFIDTPRAVCI